MVLKDKLYNYFVRTNGRVWYEYERYVRENIEEHRLHRLKHLRLLLKLNWFYRVKKGNTPYLYWDVPLNPIKDTVSLNKNVRMPYRGIESNIGNIRGPQHFVKQVLRYDIVSFDVFDTLIFRPVLPKDIFKILEHQNGIQHFALLREQTEEILRTKKYENCCSREITLAEIYSEIERKTGLLANEGLKAEIELEKELCYANPYMQKVFNMLRACGKRIIITTDMYLPTEVIASILHKNGFNQFEKIFVSGDVGSSKASGELYGYIRSMYQGKSIVHIGDNLHSDIKMSKKNDIASILYKNVNEVGMPYRAEGMSPIFSSAYACLVNAKLHCGYEHFSPEYEYGYIYGGFYVLGYVNWIHKFAVEHDIEKVLFLARDGEIYKKIFDILYSDVQSEYMLCSRSMMVRCSVRRNRYDFLRRNLFYRALNEQRYTVEKLLADLGIEDCIDEVYEYYNFSKNTVINLNNYEMLMNFVIAKMDVIEGKLSNEEKALRQYVNCLIGEAKKIAVVDVGWAGSAPKNIKYLIEKEWSFDCRVYGLLAAESAPIPGEDIYSYIFSNRFNRIHYDSHYGGKRGNLNNDLFEIFTQASSPSVKRIYLDVEGNVQFEFSAPIVEGYKMINEIQRGIVDFAMDYIKAFKNYSWLLDITGYDAYIPFRTVKRDIAYFSKMLGDFPIETNTGGSLYEPTKLCTILN